MTPINKNILRLKKKCGMMNLSRKSNGGATMMFEIRQRLGIAPKNYSGNLL